MSTPIKYLLKVLPSPGMVDFGKRNCLDLGGGNGHLREVMEERGYFYVNVDIKAGSDVVADVHALPFKDEVFHLIISKDSLEHFYAPKKALAEAARVLIDQHKFVIIVPWMYPYHGNDYWRFSYQGLECMLSSSGLRIEKIDTPLWIFTTFSILGSRVFSSLGLAFIGRILRKLGYLLDDLFAPKMSAFAASYRMVARKGNDG